MACVFLGAFGLGFVVVLCAPLRYEASARLLLAPSRESITQGLNDPVTRARAEIAVLRSQALAGKVVGGIGARRLYPNLQSSTDADRAEALDAFDRDLLINLSDQTGEIRIAYVSHDQGLAVIALDRLLAAYKDYRRNLPGLSQAAPLAQQRLEFETRLELADDAIQSFLKKNGVRDFKAELALNAQLAADLTHDVADGKAQLAEADARMRAIQDVVQDRSSSDEMRAALMLDSARLQGEVTAQAQRLIVLQKESAAAMRRRDALQSLAPEYERLMLAREALVSGVRRFADREEDARAETAIRRASITDVRFIDRVALEKLNPYQKEIGSVLAALFALLAALAVGLWRTLGAASLPTPAAAERYVGLPVLAVAPRIKRRRA